eukprot:scaffold135240_cov62-Attheya_sp.AAC.1
MHYKEKNKIQVRKGSHKNRRARFICSGSLPHKSITITLPSQDILKGCGREGIYPLCSPLLSNPVCRLCDGAQIAAQYLEILRIHRKSIRKHDTDIWYRATKSRRRSLPNTTAVVMEGTWWRGGRPTFHRSFRRRRMALPSRPPAHDNGRRTKL